VNRKRIEQKEARDVDPILRVAGEVRKDYSISPEEEHPNGGRV